MKNKAKKNELILRIVEYAHLKAGIEDELGIDIKDSTENKNLWHVTISVGDLIYVVKFNISDLDNQEITEAIIKDAFDSLANVKKRWLSEN